MITAAVASEQGGATIFNIPFQYFILKYFHDVYEYFILKWSLLQLFNYFLLVMTLLDTYRRIGTVDSYGSKYYK